MSDLDGELYEDAEQLVRLLCLLPSPTDGAARTWWDQFATAERRAHALGASGTPDSGWAGYMANNLAHYREASTRTDARELASYCLMFFDEPSDEMAELASAGLDFSSSGRRLLNSICETAWRLFVPLELAARRGEIG